MTELAEADIVIDQIVIGWYGVLAVEAMALGKAVVAFIRDDLVDEVPQGVLVNASPKTIARRLRELIVDPDLRADLGKSARRYVETYHAAEVVAERLRTLYREVSGVPHRDASIRLFADGIDNSLRLMALNKQAAAAKALAKQAPTAETANAQSPAPVAAAKKAAKPRPKRTMLQRIAHASPAKVINRIQRILGRA